MFYISQKYINYVNEEYSLIFSKSTMYSSVTSVCFYSEWSVPQSSTLEVRCRWNRLNCSMLEACCWFELKLGNKQLAPLDHHENFGKFSYADEGTHMDQVPAQTGNVLPTSNFSGYYGSDVPQPFNISKDSASNTCLTWNTLDSSTDNRLMLHFSGHTSLNKDNIQLHEQTSAELNNNSGNDTQYLPAYTRIHWTPEEDE